MIGVIRDLEALEEHRSALVLLASEAEPADFAHLPEAHRDISDLELSRLVLEMSLLVDLDSRGYRRRLSLGGGPGLIGDSELLAFLFD